MWKLLRNFFTRSTNYLVIQLDDKVLGCADAHKTGNKFSYKTTKQYSLTNNQVADNRLFNVTYISKLVEEHCQSNNLGKPRLIIETTLLSLESPNNFTLLQLALCLSKSGLIVETIIDKNDNKQHNLLNNFMPTGYQATTPLLITFTCMLLFFGVATSAWYRAQTTILQDLDNQHINQSNIIQMLQKKVKVTHELEKKKSDLQNTINHFASLQALCNNPHDLLVSVAQKMPSESLLTSIKINKQAQNPTKKAKMIPSKTKTKVTPQITITPETGTSLHFEGITYKPDCISECVKELAELFPHGSFSLLHITKVKKPRKKDDSPVRSTYAFAIEGSLVLSGQNNLKFPHINP